MKNKKGFTLVEVIIVIIIVGILALVIVPVYNNYVERAYVSEGIAIAGTIKSAEDVYYAEFGHYALEGGILGEGFTTKGELTGIDLSDNKYFNYFKVTNEAGEDPRYPMSYVAYIMSSDGAVAVSESEFCLLYTNNKGIGGDESLRLQTKKGMKTLSI